MLRRGRRYHQRVSESDSDFETPALRDVNRQARPAARDYDSDDSDEKSESGLGDSPEEELLEEDEEEEGGDNADSDDDAPEDLSFTSSREVEKKRMQNILQEIRKGREETKEKRRKKNDLFKTQKEEKLAALSKRKLPTELLEAVAAKKQKTKAQTVKTDESKDTEEEEGEATASALADSSQSAGFDSDSEGSDFDDDGPGLLGDFVPLMDSEKTNEDEEVVVVPLSKTKKQAAPVSQGVADFKQKMLYSSHIKRVSSQKMRATHAKRKALKGK